LIQIAIAVDIKCLKDFVDQAAAVIFGLVGRELGQQALQLIIRAIASSIRLVIDQFLKLRLRNASPTAKLRLQRPKFTLPLLIRPVKPCMACKGLHLISGEKAGPRPIQKLECRLNELTATCRGSWCSIGSASLRLHRFEHLLQLIISAIDAQVRLIIHQFGKECRVNAISNRVSLVVPAQGKKLRGPCIIATVKSSLHGKAPHLLLVQDAVAIRIESPEHLLNQSLPGVLRLLGLEPEFHHGPRRVFLQNSRLEAHLHEDTHSVWPAAHQEAVHVGLLGLLRRPAQQHPAVLLAPLGPQHPELQHLQRAVLEPEDHEAQDLLGLLHLLHEQRESIAAPLADLADVILKVVGGGDSLGLVHHRAVPGLLRIHFYEVRVFDGHC